MLYRNRPPQAFEDGRYTSVLDIYTAIMMACRAWDQVKPSTFSNCWIKTGIVPGKAIDEVQVANGAVQEGHQGDVQLLLTRAFEDMNFSNEDVDEFICDPDEEKDGYEIPSIIDILTEKNMISLEKRPEDLVVVAPKIFTLREARYGAEAILSYLWNHDSPDLAKSMNNIISYLDLRRIDQLKQNKLPFEPLNMDTTY